MLVFVRAWWSCLGELVASLKVHRMKTFFCSHSCREVVCAASRTIGNITRGSDAQTQVIVDCFALPALYKLLHSKNATFVGTACWTISNIAAGNPQQVQAIIDSNIFPVLVELLKTADYAIRKEAVWAVMNATCDGVAKHVKYLAYVGCIPALCDLLTVSDENVTLTILKGLENILKCGQECGEKPNPYEMLIEECSGETWRKSINFILSQLRYRTRQN